MNAELEVARIIKEHGGVLTRTKKHKIFKFPNGETFTQSSTPGSDTSWANHLCDLRKTLGIADPDRGKPGDRRERKNRPGRATTGKIESAKLDNPLADQLRGIGLLEQSLQSKLEAEQRICKLHERHIELTEAALQRKEAICGRCLWCRIKERLSCFARKGAR